MAGYALTNGIRFHHDPQLSANVLCYEGTGANAQVLSYKAGNLITDFGENRTLFALFSTSTNITGIATGNTSSVDQTDTGLDTEATTSGFHRVACNASAVWTNGGDYARNFTATFYSNETISVNAVALTLSTTGSAADAFAISFITDGTQHQFPDSTPASYLTVVWILTINAN